MMNILYKTCRKSSGTLTPDALRRLRMFSLFALLGFPIFMILGGFNVLDGLPRFVKGMIAIMLLGSSVPLAANGFYNQMSKGKSRLDEWELAQKEKAEAFTYRFIVAGTIIAIVLSFAFLVISGIDFDTASFSLADVISIFMTLAIIYLFLPITYIAWTQKPLPTED